MKTPNPVAKFFAQVIGRAAIALGKFHFESVKPVGPKPPQRRHDKLDCPNALLRRHSSRYGGQHGHQSLIQTWLNEGRRVRRPEPKLQRLDPVSAPAPDAAT